MKAKTKGELTKELETLQKRQSEVAGSLKTVIFRVLQEAMNNVAKHSKANRVNFMLRRVDGAIELGIQDNGQGFDPAEA